MARSKIRLGDLDFAVTDEGSGEPVLLLHGFPDSARLWRHQIPALLEAGYRVIAPDQRGFGESDKPQAPEAYALEHVLGDVVLLLGKGHEASIIGPDGERPWSERATAEAALAAAEYRG